MDIEVSIDFKSKQINMKHLEVFAMDWVGEYSNTASQGNSKSLKRPYAIENVMPKGR